MSVDAGNTLDLDMDRLLFNLGTINATPYIEIKKEEMQARPISTTISACIVVRLETKQRRGWEESFRPKKT